MKPWEPYGVEPCLQCKGPNDPYMIEFDLWNQITVPGERRKFLCLKCVELRLGRPLKLEDFIQENHHGQPLPINFGCFGFDCRKYVAGEYETSK